MKKNIFFVIFLIFSSCNNIVDADLLDPTVSLSLKDIVLPERLSLEEDEVLPDVEEYHLYIPIAYSRLDANAIPNLEGAKVEIVKDGMIRDNFKDFPLSIGDNFFEIRLSKQHLFAKYYLNVTKWKQLSNYVKPDVPISNQEFGWHISLHKDFMAVGAQAETTVAGASAGAVYVFKHIGNEWIQDARIIAPNGEAGDRFGNSVYLYNDILVIGAPYENSSTSGIATDTSGADNLGNSVGAVYIYKRNILGIWDLKYYVKPSDAVNTLAFGWSVALDKKDGKTIMVNAGWESTGLPFSGAVYVFEFDDSGVLTQTAKLKASVPHNIALFGASMYIYNGRMAIGANYDDTNGIDSGLVYVFEKNNLGVWTETAILSPLNPDANDQFGFSVVIYDDSIIVGAPYEDSNPILGLADNSLVDSGILYEFKLQAGIWTQTSYFKPQNIDAGDLLGWNMDFDASSVVIGAPGEDGSGTGLNPSDDNLAIDSGAVYVFKKDINGEWEEDAYLKAINTDAGDKFGHSVVIDNGRLFIVASDEKSLDADDSSNNGGTKAGAGYFYE